MARTDKKPDESEAEPPVATVVPLFPSVNDEEDIPEIDFFSASKREAEPASPPRPPAVNLAGKPKLWLLIGAGNSGKTVQARWMVERMRQAERHGVLAAVDPTTRSLATWFPRVEQPTGEPGRWLRRLLSWMIQHKAQGVIDLGGGGETALRTIAEGLAEAVEGVGISLIPAYCLTRRIDDVEIIRKGGVMSQQSVLILSPGPVSESYEVDAVEFRPVLQHSVVRAAIEGGAETVWIPPLEHEAMAPIEQKRLSFEMAARGLIPEGADPEKVKPLSPLGQFLVRRWLDRMEEAHKRIETWLP